MIGDCREASKAALNLEFGEGYPLAQGTQQSQLRTRQAAGREGRALACAPAADPSRRAGR